MARPSWSGFLRLSLVSVPVNAYPTATTGGGRIALHQLHAPCHSRIRYQKTCPIHGEVSNDEIVKGYEYAKDEYVVIDPEELKHLHREGDRSITIEAFIHPEKIDPIYFADKSYYLTPDGPAGEKAYVLLREAMVEERLYGIVQTVQSGKEELMLLRPVGELLAMTALDYESQVRDPVSLAPEVPRVAFSPKELELTKTLVEATTAEHFDLGQYRDRYTEELRELIEAKVAGREIVVAPSEAPRPVVNLMEALRASVAEMSGRKEGQRPSAERTRGESVRQPRTPRRRKTG